MNQAQLKYLRARCERLYADKIKQVTLEFTDIGYSLSAPERVKALKEGRWKYVGPEDAPAHQFFYNIRFTDDRPRVVNHKDLTPALAELKTIYETLMDELILGDNEKALELIKEFEAL